MSAEVDEDATALFGARLQRTLALSPRVAPKRAEHITGEALTVYPYQHALRRAPGGGDVAQHQGEVFETVGGASVCHSAEQTGTGRQGRLGDWLDGPLGSFAIADQVRDGDQRKG